MSKRGWWLLGAVFVVVLIAITATSDVNLAPRETRSSGDVDRILSGAVDNSRLSESDVSKLESYLDTDSGKRSVVSYAQAATGAAGMCTTDVLMSDTDNNGVIDIDDVVNVVLDFGTDGSRNNGDVNDDGFVDVDDVVFVVLNFDGDCTCSVNSDCPLGFDCLSGICNIGGGVLECGNDLCEVGESIGTCPEDCDHSDYVIPFETDKLLASNPNVGDSFGNDWFGSAVDIYGDYAVVGVPLHDLLCDNLDTNRDIYKSTDGGISFTKVNDDYGGGVILGMTINSLDEVFIVDSLSGVWKSVDSGSSWTQTNSDYNQENSNGADDIYVDAQNNIYILDGTRLWKSSDGTNWQLINSDYNGASFVSGEKIAINNNGNIYLIDENADIWESTDAGANFVDITDDIFVTQAIDMVANSLNELFIFDTFANIWKSTNNGINWTRINSNYNGNVPGVQEDFYHFVSLDGEDHMYVVNYNNIWISEDFGVSWNKVNDDFNTDQDFSSGLGIVVNSNNEIIVGDGNTESVGNCNSGNAYVFERNGFDWTEIQQLQPAELREGDGFGKVVEMDGEFIFVSGVGFSGADKGHSPRGFDSTNRIITDNSGVILAMNNEFDLFHLDYSNGVPNENQFGFASVNSFPVAFDDEGSVWTVGDFTEKRADSYFTSNVRGAIEHDDYLYVVTENGEVHRSLGTGFYQFENWQQVSVISSQGEPRGITAFANKLMVVTNDGEIFESNNNGGSSWQLLTSSFSDTTNLNQYGITDDETYLYVLDDEHDVWRSSDGTNWIEINQGNIFDDVYAITDTGSSIYLITENNKIYHSSDQGVSWNLDLRVSLYENSGAVYVYKKQGNSWDFHQKLAPDDLIGSDLFGDNMAYDGTTLAVYSRFDENDPELGSIYLFEHNTQTDQFDLVQKIVLPFGFQQLGTNSLDINGKYLVMGGSNVLPRIELDLNVQSCSESDSNSQNDYSDQCQGSYPADCGADANSDVLSCDDGNTEQASINQNTFAGYEITGFDSSVDDCGKISAVDICWESWVNDESGIGNCVIEVDADGGSSYTTVNTDCPTTEQNPGIVCESVSVSENWQCENFFDSSGQRAKARMSVQNTGAASKILDVDSFFFRVKYHVGLPPDGGDGEVLVYERIGNDYELTQMLHASDGELFDNFGSEVHVGTDFLLISSDNEDNPLSGFNSPGEGAVYSFINENGVWVENQKITDPNGQPFDNFGHYLEIVGDIAYVSSHRDDDLFAEAGSVHVYSFNGQTWDFIDKFYADDAGVDDRFGSSVSADEDQIIIGAIRDDDGGGNAGAAYVFNANLEFCGDGIVQTPNSFGQNEVCDGNAVCTAPGGGEGIQSCEADCSALVGSCVGEADVRVFITSGDYTFLDFGESVAGADALCTQIATNAGLGGQWQAWLSDSTTSPADRFVPYSQPYVLLDAQNTRIADDWADLTDGFLQNKINIDENGNVDPPGTSVWTGTHTDGAGSGAYCDDWTFGTDEFGTAGRRTSTGSQWTDWADTSCGELDRHLYCFEILT